MRQSGLSEQFFALIKLALELNVSANKFAKLQPLEKDQHTLVEYEEVILSSGLPMNEVWLRIEKLRQNFYFLPCPEDRSSSDPQRMVFNEDIVHFVYPLVNKEYSFNLIIIILKLLKVPLPPHSLKHCFFTKQENCSEFDSIEDILHIFLTKSFKHDALFEQILFDFIKDFSIGPSYISAIVGSEIYLNCLIEVLLIFSECSTELTSKQRNIFLVLWLKFERILVCLDKLMEKTSIEKFKKLRSKIKNLLKREENRNSLVLYTEYALIEYEMGNMESMQAIFVASIGQSTGQDDDCSRSEFYAAHIAYVEVLMQVGDFDKAALVLTCLALQGNLLDYTMPGEMSEPKKLKAIQQFGDKLKQIIFIEQNVEIMELEQCFLPDYLISMIKSKVYYLFIVRSKNEAISELETLLRKFPEKNNRHSHVREMIYEVYSNIVQLPNKHGNESNVMAFQLLKRGLEEFPHNLFLIRMAATIDGQVSF